MDLYKLIPHNPSSNLSSEPQKYIEQLIDEKILVIQHTLQKRATSKSLEMKNQQERTKLKNF